MRCCSTLVLLFISLFLRTQAAAAAAAVAFSVFALLPKPSNGPQRLPACAQV